jgi:lipoate-protein ligase A
MPPLRCRLLPFRVAGGAWQMAADEVMLEAAAAGVASLRFYGWPEANLSLGYFQPEAARRSDARLAALPWVRRPSGGSALVHHHELTYALAVPAGRPGPAQAHAVIAAALAGLGARVRPCGPDEGRKQGEVLCFLHHTPGDLLLGASKVVGSAQRKLRGAVLQHGGILLAASPAAPDLLGIAEQTGLRLTPAEVAAAVTEELARSTGWAVEADDWSALERPRVERLVAEKYATARWNFKR